MGLPLNGRPCLAAKPGSQATLPIVSATDVTDPCTAGVTSSEPLPQQITGPYPTTQSLSQPGGRKPHILRLKAKLSDLPNIAAEKGCPPLSADTLKSMSHFLQEADIPKENEPSFFHD